MLDLYSLDTDSLRQTKRLLRDEFKKRGWQAYVAYPSATLITVVRDDGVKFDINSSTPPTTSFVAAKTADDKFATYSKLESLPLVRQLETRLLKTEDDMYLLSEMLAKYPKIVIKPLDGAHGNGVTTNIRTLEEAHAAIESVRLKKPQGTLLVQAQYETDITHEVRVLCINGAYVAAIYRQPARVFGDGIHTVTELIEIENSQPQRGEPYVQLYASINIDEVRTYLGEAIYAIPGSGEQVNVLGVANYGAGGETIDVTDVIPQWMTRDAEAVARHMDLPLVGVDFIMKQYPTPDATQDELSPVVLEINRTPSLGIHDEPTDGVSRQTVATYVDYLASLY